VKEILLGAGLICVITAIIGGPLKGLGYEFPLLQSKRRRWALAVFGLILLALLLAERFISPLIKQSPPLSSESFSPTWVETDIPLKVINNQVYIYISWPQPSAQAVNLQIVLPTGTLDFGVTTPATPQSFLFDGHTYFLRVIEVRDKKARIIISEKS
jgi:hypothetical protein